MNAKRAQIVGTVVYLQDRTHRAGAQTCLARILKDENARQWDPVLVCSRPGWLTSECEQAGVRVICEEFPRSRSLSSRLFGNARFANEVAQKLRGSTSDVAIVHANDHLEGILGLMLAKKLRTPRAIFLRSPGMTKRDYFKYRCNEYDLIAAVGDKLQSRVQAWDPARKIELIHDGITEAEFSEPKTKLAKTPDRVLVIGSPLDWKGWADLTEALYLLEQERALPPMIFDFTGAEPNAKTNDLKLSRLVSSRCNFLGRVEGFRDLVRGYDLVVNPTRMESFGMAAVEVLAAGVPLLSSQTGIIEQVQMRKEMLFQPRKPSALAASLRNVLTRWKDIDFGLVSAQKYIRQNFLIGNTIAKLQIAYDCLLAAKYVSDY